MYGLNVTDMKALGILMRQGDQTAGALMEHLGVTSGAVTGVIDRLVRRGYATRRTDPADRRRVIVALDPEGLAGYDNVYLDIGSAFDALYTRYTTAELRFLARHLATATTITREQAARLRDRAAGSA